MLQIEKSEEVQVQTRIEQEIQKETEQIQRQKDCVELKDSAVFCERIKEEKIYNLCTLEEEETEETVEKRAEN